MDYLQAIALVCRYNVEIVDIFNYNSALTILSFTNALYYC